MIFNWFPPPASMLIQGGGMPDPPGAWASVRMREDTEFIHQACWMRILQDFCFSLPHLFSMTSDTRLCLVHNLNIFIINLVVESYKS